MRLPRIYTPQHLAVDNTLILEQQASNHLTRVLRFKIAQQVELFNGQGFAYIAEIIDADKKAVHVRILAQKDPVMCSPLYSEIAVAVSKGDKMELIVQKATELGVNSIYPVLSQRTDVKLDDARWQKKCDYWQQVAISACEQSGRNDEVKIYPVQKLTQYVQQCQHAVKLIFHPSATTRFAELPVATHVAMCFGSEGGFSEDEVQFATQHGFVAVCLGSRILRAETAPLTALSMAQLQWGDF